MLTPDSSGPRGHPAETHIDLRVNESIVAVPERIALHFLATRMPRWVTPDGLTIFGVFGGVVVMLGYWLSRGDPLWLWLANLGLVFHWAGDSLDGTVARLRHIERPRYGFYLDQVIDVLGNLLVAIGVGLSRDARMDMALFVLATFHMLAIQVLVRAIVDREFHLAVGRLGPTEMRIGIFAMNLGIMAFGAPGWDILGLRLTWCDLLMLGTGIVLLALYANQMRRHLERFSREDPAKH